MRLLRSFLVFGMLTMSLLPANVLNGDAPRRFRIGENIRSIREISSIRSHVEISLGETSREATILKKGQERIRMVVQDPTDVKVSVRIIYEKGKLRREVHSPKGTWVHEPEGIEAAIYLFDLIALNPAYHFPSGSGRFDRGNKVLQDFSLKLERTHEEDPEAESKPFTSISLYSVEDGRETLLRTIRYSSFAAFDGPLLEPDVLYFKDERTGNKGRITVNALEYNSGIPDFVFNIPKNE